MFDVRFHIIDYFRLSHENVSEDGISDMAHLHATNVHTQQRRRGRHVLFGVNLVAPVTRTVGRQVKRSDVTDLSVLLILFFPLSLSSFLRQLHRPPKRARASVIFLMIAARGSLVKR